MKKIINLPDLIFESERVNERITVVFKGNDGLCKVYFKDTVFFDFVERLSLLTKVYKAEIIFESYDDDDI